MIAASSDHRAPKASSETLFIVASRRPRGIWVLECLTEEDKKRHWPRIPTDMKTTSKQIHRFWGAEQGDSLDVFPCFSTTCFYWCIFYSRKETWKSNQYAHFPYIRFFFLFLNLDLITHKPWKRRCLILRIFCGLTYDNQPTALKHTGQSSCKTRDLLTKAQPSVFASRFSEPTSSPLGWGSRGFCLLQPLPYL